jgi:YD repeat-containing protein
MLNALDATPMSYDAAGNLTARLDGPTQNYDDADQLTAINGSAITRIGTTSATGSTSNTLTLTLPTGIQNQDQALLAVSLPDGKSHYQRPRLQPRPHARSGGTKPGQIAIYRRTLNAADTTLAISFQGKFDKTAVLGVYRNVDPANPIRDATGNGNVAASLTMAGVNGEPKDQPVLLAGATGTAGTWTPPSNMTVRANKTGATTDAVLIDQPLTASGSSGTRTAAHSASTALSGVLLTLKPVSTHSVE